MARLLAGEVRCTSQGGRELHLGKERNDSSKTRPYTQLNGCMSTQVG
ncbi:MAG: hypothetical protein RIM23_21770 [Coleofasciculus sp. G3-WIS-01]